MKINLIVKKIVWIIFIVLATFLLVIGFLTNNIAMTISSLLLALVSQKKSYHLLFKDYDERIKLKKTKNLERR